MSEPHNPPRPPARPPSRVSRRHFLGAAGAGTALAAGAAGIGLGPARAVRAVAPTPGPQAIRVYGQPNFAANAVGHGPDGLWFPIGLAQDGQGGLYVADRNNSRVLYFAAGGTTAGRVYGQRGDLRAYTQNYDGVGGSGLPSADTLNYPVAIALAADGSLYVTDRENHRVLHYAADGTTTADRVYGQFGSFVTNPPNNDGLGGATSRRPTTSGSSRSGSWPTAAAGYTLAIRATTGSCTLHRGVRRLPAASTVSSAALPAA